MQPIKASLIGLATFFIFYLSMLSMQFPWMVTAGVIGLLSNTFISGFSATYNLRDGMLTALAYSAPLAVFSALTVGDLVLHGKGAPFIFWCSTAFITLCSGFLGVAAIYLFRLIRGENKQ
ncbi:hypothetical protein [Porticoccus sp.]|uniref:hypothetical protein n=1 Tax=Porticoccus sp. TaxID=2024853 RepID=UPI003F69E215